MKPYSVTISTPLVSNKRIYIYRVCVAFVPNSSPSPLTAPGNSCEATTPTRRRNIPAALLAYIHASLGGLIRRTELPELTLSTQPSRRRGDFSCASFFFPLAFFRYFSIFFRYGVRSLYSRVLVRDAI